jgi:hypothetical protein
LLDLARGLVSLDGAGQAGLIKAAVDRLPQLQRACILARYSPQFEECPCCGGNKPLDEYKLAIATLREWALSSFSGLSHRQMREAIVRSYFEGGVSISKVSDELKISRKTAYAQKKAIFDALKTLETQAQSDISGMLERLFTEAA